MWKYSESEYLSPRYILNLNKGAVKSFGAPTPKNAFSGARSEACFGRSPKKKTGAREVCFCLFLQFLLVSVCFSLFLLVSACSCSSLLVSACFCSLLLWSCGCEFNAPAHTKHVRIGSQN